GKPRGAAVGARVEEAAGQYRARVEARGALPAAGLVGVAAGSAVDRRQREQRRLDLLLAADHRRELGLELASALDVAGEPLKVVSRHQRAAEPLEIVPGTDAPVIHRAAEQPRQRLARILGSGLDHAEPVGVDELE